MANAFYDKGLENLCNGNFDWLGGDWRLIAVDHGVDTPVPSTDDFLNDIGAGARIATSPALASKTNVGGILDAADPTFSAVSGASFESVTLYNHTGTDSTAGLFVFWDTITGLPFTPSGTDILFIFDNTPTVKVCRP